MIQLKIVINKNNMNCEYWAVYIKQYITSCYEYIKPQRIQGPRKRGGNEGMHVRQHFFKSEKVPFSLG